jgi:hypothetical protein
MNGKARTSLVRAFFLKIGYSSNMNRLILMLLLLLPAAPVLAEVYKWVDEAGNVHYTDMPDQGQEATKLPAFQYKSPVPSTPTPPLSTSTPPATSTSIPSDFAPDAGVTYSITITSPEQDATVRDNQGIVPVAIDTSPLPREGLVYQMYLDGKPWYEPFSGQNVFLSNVDRGTHTIHVQLLNSQGGSLGQSNSVTFHLHRTSILRRTPR